MKKNIPELDKLFSGREIHKGYTDGSRSELMLLLMMIGTQILYLTLA
jgi:hypothetical protein